MIPACLKTPNQFFRIFNRDLSISPIRSEPGLENGLMATVQCFFRDDGEDDLAGERAHSCGPSTGNQRIECFWSFFRRSRMFWWINFFEDLIDNGSINMSKTINRESLWYCFHRIIQADHDFVTLHLNTHYIRAPRHETAPGRPDERLLLPETLMGKTSRNLCRKRRLQRLHQC